MRRNQTANPVRPVAPAAGGVAGANPFTLNPAPTAGVGPYGQVPGPIGKPPSLYQGAQTIYPGLTNLTTAAGGNIASELAGEFSPQTENALWDTANRFGVASGMPGAGLWSNRFMGNVAGAKEKLQQQGQQDYGAFLGNLAKTTDDPALLAAIAAANASKAAAPNPEEAAKALAAAYQNALIEAANKARGPGGGTVGGGVNLSPGAGTVPRPSLPVANLGPQSFNPNAYRNGTFSTSSRYDTGAPFMPNTSMDQISNPVLDQGGQFDQPGQNYDPFATNFEDYFYDPNNWTAPNDTGAGLDQVATGNNYDPNANMSDEDWWAYLMGEGG